MAKDIYIFSGLGVDERVFKNIDFSGCNPHFIKWVLPENNETLKHYCSCLAQQIKTKNPILLGLSFGGIVAVEIAKQIETENVILIASAKTKKEIPFYYRWPGITGLHKLIPASLMLHPNFITNWLFGITSETDKKLLKEILDDTEPIFFKWAIDKIVTWTNVELPVRYTHIHGTADRILPIHYVTCDTKVLDGGHFMTLNKAKELNDILKQFVL